ncbi:MAG TPA: recombination mediator RecR [bacterium]
MDYPSKTLEQVIQSFSELPGIGEKTAQRIALFLLGEGRTVGERLAGGVAALNQNVSRCSVCFNLTEENPCSFCRDPRRDRRTVCVVEDLKDFLAIERTGHYRGLYHILGGVLSPLEGIGEAELHIRELLDRIGPEVDEVILATNPTVEGEMTASHLLHLLKGKNVKVTRIARGIPFGGALEFNDTVTIAKALEGRLRME